MRCRRECRVASLGCVPWVVLLIALSASSALAQGARSLDIQPGARQNGLGAAGVALFGDPSDALWWNPAGLGFADRTSVQYTHAKLLPGLEDLPYSQAAVATPLGRWGGFGTSFTSLNYGDFWGFESAPSIAIGVRVHPMVSVGATLKWVDTDLIGFTGSTFTGDVGGLLRVDREPWRFGFGAMYQNFAGRLDYEGLGSVTPSHNIKLGASATAPVRLSEELTLRGVAVVDFNHSEAFGGFNTWNGGVEGGLTISDVIRLAGRVGYYDDPQGRIQDFTFGGGVQAGLVSFDVARIPEARNTGLGPVVKITAGIHVDLSGDRPRWRLD